MRLIFPGVSYSKPGGTENLIAQVIKTARIDFNVSSIVIGDKGSYLVSRLEAEGIPFIFLHDCEVDDFVFEESDLWVHTHNTSSLFSIKNKPGKAIIWCVLISSLTDWNRFRFEVRLTGRKFLGNFMTRRLIRVLLKKNALLAMDGATSDSICDFLGLRARIPLLPVAIETDGAPLKCEFSNNRKECYVVSYIGRSDDVWKIKPIKKIVFDLQNLGKKFLVNIYTDCQEPFEKELSSFVGGDVDVRYHIGMFGSQLREHLVANSDIHFSMGLSALEGALCRIPTILVDPSFSDLPHNYRYRWLYDMEYFSLGRFIGDSVSSFPGMKMREVLEVLENQYSTYDVAEKNRQYVIHNHAPSHITQILLAVNSCASNKDIGKVTPSSWAIARKLRRIVST